MTLVSLRNPITFPGILLSPYAAPTVGTAATLSSAGHYYSVIASAKEDLVISHVGFRAGTATGSPTCTLSIETVDTSGNPAGTDGFGSTAGTSATISSNSWVLTALGGSATISRGSLFAIKVALASGTSQVVQHIANVSLPNGTAMPYTVINTGSAVKGASSNLPMLAVGSNSTTFYDVPGILAADSYSAGAFNNTNSAKRGLRFVPSYNCRAIGVRTYHATATGDYNAVLTNDSGTELSSSSTSVEGAATPSAHSTHNVYFDSPVTLSAGTAYRVAIEPTSATNCNVSTITLPSSDYYSSTAAGSSSVATYAALASGTWTDSTTQLPFMDVLIDQIDDGTGAGGVIGVIGG
jgi:hypothetical protein